MATIYADDIKLLASERMTDNSDGGGRLTNTVIQDGVENNVFPDVSSDDAAGGRVRIRKVFSAVNNDGVDSLLGARGMISADSDNANISAALFTTGSWTDERDAAAEYVEGYLFAGIISQMKLIGLHREGQQSIAAYQRVGAALPEVGDTIVLSEESGGEVVADQYFKITDVEHEDVEYEDSQGVFVRTVVTMGVSTKLGRDFEGHQPTRSSASQPPTVIRLTNPVDSAEYKSVFTVTEALEPNDLVVQCNDIFVRVVPSSQGSAPITDAKPPGSVVEITSGGVDFEVSSPSHTGRIAITENNRDINYVFVCQPIPAPGVLTIEYRSQGRWYTLQDDGSGAITGSGSGSLNSSTGSVSVTLAALPDSGSDIIFTWAAGIHYTDRAGTAVFEPVSISVTLPYAADKTAGITMTWLDTAEQERTATAGSDGVISGDASGAFVYELGELYAEFSHAALPAAGAVVSIEYDKLTKQRQTLTTTPVGSTATFTLGNTPVKPGSVRIRVPYKSAQETVGGSNGTLSRTWPYVTEYYDDGAGNLTGGAGAGTINYATGDCVIPGSMSRTLNAYIGPDGWVTDTYSIAISGPVDAYYTLNSATPSEETAEMEMGPITIRLLPGLQDSIVPGTLRFTVGGQAFSDRAGQGLLYLNDGTVAGSVDYGARTATLVEHSIQAADDADIVITSMVTSRGNWTEYEYYFRAPGSPLQPGSLIVTATATDGTLLTGNADFNGDITGTLVAGTVNQQTGVVAVKFGELEADDDLTTDQKNEWWYDADNIDVNGDIWVPTFVYPSSIRFATVVQTFLPLDAELLGVDPVRLPPDGRVPGIRVGDRAAVHHTGTYTVENPAQANTTYDLGRERLAWIRVMDQNDQVVPDDRYTSDLDAGEITMAVDLDLTGFVQPLKVLHTILDEATVTDVQINGQVTLGLAISHDFPANETRLSTVLRHGDMGSRVTVPFAQAAWTSTWSDDLIGAAPAAQYDNVNYPMVTTNIGSLGYRDRYRFNFTTSGNFEFISETRGVIATGSTSVSFEPVNPITGETIISVDKDGWGGGWQPGNQVRVNIIDASYPYWILQCVQPGLLTGQPDKLQLEQLGDVDA